MKGSSVGLELQTWLSELFYYDKLQYVSLLKELKNKLTRIFCTKGEIFSYHNKGIFSLFDNMHKLYLVYILLQIKFLYFYAEKLNWCKK